MSAHKWLRVSPSPPLPSTSIICSISVFDDSARYNWDWLSGIGSFYCCMPSSNSEQQGRFKCLVDLQFAQLCAFTDCRHHLISLFGAILRVHSRCFCETTERNNTHTPFMITYPLISQDTQTYRHSTYTDTAKTAVCPAVA